MLATWGALKPPSELPFMFTWPSWKGWRASHSAEIEPDPEMVVLDALSHKYTNQPFRVRFEDCVTLRITVTSFRHKILHRRRPGGVPVLLSSCVG